MDKKALTKLVALCYEKAGRAKTVKFLDDLKSLGFEIATKAGISISIDDMKVPDNKNDLIEANRESVLSVEEEYRDGLITAGERYNKIRPRTFLLSRRVYLYHVSNAEKIAQCRPS